MVNASTTFAALVCAIGCASKQPPEPAPPPPPPTRVDFQVTVDEAPAPAAPGAERAPGAELAPGAPPSDRPGKDQPPHIKLKLGHYVNRERNIGVTIDLTTKVDNVTAIPPAKVRFDHTAEVLTLDGQHGSSGRIDYMHRRRVVLQTHEGGRMTVFVHDPDSDRVSGPIDVRRDGDADPL